MLRLAPPRLYRTILRLQNGVRNISALKPDIVGSQQLVKSCSLSSSHCNMANITTKHSAKMVVEPAFCLHDEAVRLHVSGLQPREAVTLEASMLDIRGVTFFSFAHYRADDVGQVDVSTMESLGGSYKGVFPMGLISSLAATGKKHKYTRFFKRDVENPNIVTLSVFRRHLTNDELLGDERSEPLSTVVHFRHYMAPGVQRIPVHHGRVRGCLFLPPGDGPFPGVVDMFGTAGGLLEYRAAQLASRGIASLALAYLAYEDLPKSLDAFDLSYFEEAVDFLLKHEKVQKPNVGAIGVSKGGDLVLSMATYIPEVTAGVWINGCISNVQSRLNFKDSYLPGLGMDASRVKIDGDVFECFEVLDNPEDYPETIIPIENANADFLFLVSEDDRNWNSEQYADIAVKRLEMAGKRNITVHKYPGAGHLLEPPFSPLCRASYHKHIQGNLLWGGSLTPHTEAQIHAWEATSTFLWNHLHNQSALKGKL